MLPHPLCLAVYDVTRRETFEDLAAVWMKEVEMYSTVDDLIQMVVANKVDLVSQHRCMCCCLLRGLSMRGARV